MATPTSVKFNLADWNSRYASTTDAGDRSVADATDGVLSSFDVSPGVSLVSSGLQLKAVAEGRAADDIAAALAVLNSVVVPSVFTIEFDVHLSESMPLLFEDTGSRLFVGAANAQGYSAGLLFSRQGLALATDPADPRPSLLGGSAALIFDAEGKPKASITVRMLLNGETGLVSIYIDDTAVAYDADAGGAWADAANNELRYHLDAPQAPPAYGDSIILAALARSGENVLATNTAFSVSAIRLASSLVVPEDRPIAVIDGEYQDLVGSTVELFGRSSSDVKGRALTFEWDITSRPAESVARLSGGIASKVALGTEAADNQVQLAFRSEHTTGNSWKLIVSTGSAGSLLAVVLDLAAKELRVALASDGSGDAITTPQDLVDAFSRVGAAGYVEAAAEMFRGDIVDLNATNLGVVPTGTTLFSGGAASVLMNPILLPDLAGIYGLRLRVSNGVGRSLADTHTVVVQETDQLLGLRPDSRYIWQYLPDFWDLVNDREVLSSLWSAMTQVVSAELLSTWQHGFARSIRDVGRRYQRRWTHYPLYTELPTGVTTELVTPSLLGSWDLTVGSLTSGTKAGSAITTGQGTPTIGTGLMLVLADGLPAEVVQVIQVLEETTGWRLYAAEDAFPAYKLISERFAGAWVDDAAGAADTTLHLEDKAYLDPVLASDLIRVYDEEARRDGTVLTLSAQVSPGKLALGGAESEQTITGVRLWWDHLRPPSKVLARATPYLTLSTDFDVAALGLTTGDYVEVLVVDPTTGDEVVSYLPIVATKGQAVFIGWEPLFDAMNVVSELTGADRETVGLEQLSVMTLSVMGFYRERLTAAVDDLVAIPVLGGNPNSQELTERLDFRVKDGQVAITPLWEGKATATADSADVVFDQFLRLHSEAVEATFTELAALGGVALVLNDGDAGTYRILSQSGRTVTVERPLNISGEVTARICPWSALRPGPKRLWAELAYFDNWQTVENNFGLMVGLPHEVWQEASRGQVDYLSVVRGMMFAFASGPTLGNTQLATQAMFGLPYSEVTGQIVVWEEPLSATDLGRIVIATPDDDLLTYTYPFSANVRALNPRTSRPFQAIDRGSSVGFLDGELQASFEVWAERNRESIPTEELTLAAFTPLYEAWRDSQLDPYVVLLDVVRVDDYITNPGLMTTLLPGQDIIRQYHTFVVRVPLDIAGTTEPFAVLQSFLDEAKPKHTNVLLLGALDFADEISVVDNPTYHPTMRLADTLHTAPFSYRADDGADRTKLWPGLETLGRADGTGGAWTDADVEDKYESGYAEGVVSSYSGDGSWNEHQGVVHMVSQVEPDLDVCMSKLWVPIQRTTTGDQVSLEFQVGEAIELWDVGLTAELDTPWAESPPVVEYIGAGVHPKLPFGVFNPQTEHPFTYLILGFENSNTADYSNYGAEERLYALWNFRATIGSLKGATSGALAVTMADHDPADAANDKFYHREHILSVGKLQRFAPADVLSLSNMVYIPLGGMLIEDLETEPVSLEDRPQFAASGVLDNQVQQYPYDAAFEVTNPDEQLVPSFGPGFFTDWNGLDKGVAKVRWGYTDEGVMLGDPVALADFTRVAGVEQLDLENVHIGICVRAIKGWHKTHGFLEFCIPPPDIQYVTVDYGTNVLRVEGSFFVADDDTRGTVPTANPDSFDGIKGGCWVFLRHRESQVETPVVAYTFETGNNAGKVVLGYDGNDQTSTGHILEFTAPAGLADGYYDVIVRNYRPYRMALTDPPAPVHMDEAVAAAAYVVGLSPPGEAGLGGGILGEDPFGGE